jgi:hypothetical protein
MIISLRINLILNSKINQCKRTTMVKHIGSADVCILLSTSVALITRNIQLIGDIYY